MSDEGSSLIFNSSIVGSASSSGNTTELSESDESREESKKRESKSRGDLKAVGATAPAELSSDALSSSSSEGEDERPSSPELPPEYWQIQRLVKYIKAGNPTATIISLSSLRDFDLSDKFIQMAVRDSGGLEVLLNILETDESQCKKASLAIIRVIASSPETVRTIYNMRGVETLVKCLADPSRDVKILTAETISNLCKLKKARRAIRHNDGIPPLVEMLNYEVGLIWNNGHAYDLEVARSGGMALRALAKSTKNREVIRKAGAIPFLAKLMKTKEVDVSIAVVGILQECASEPGFRAAILSAGLIKNFVEGLHSSNPQMVQFCAKAICMCAEDPAARKAVYELKGIDPLLEIIQNSEFRQNKDLLAAATGAVWKCSPAIFKSRKYVEQGIIELLVSMLEGEREDILVNISGTMEEIVKGNIEFAGIIKKCSGIPLLIKLLTIENEDLLVNTTRAIGALAMEKECRLEMERLDGFRLVWSLLKYPSLMVQASAAWAICPYVQSTKASSEMVRNYVGGLEALVQLLTSESTDVQAAVCEAVAAIASNSENLAIMSDHNVVQYLTRIALTQHMLRGGGGNNILKRCLAKAIAACSTWGHNSKEFGQRQAVTPICSYLSSKDDKVLREAAKALCALSRDPRNCITIHQCGVVRRLIRHTASRDEELREAAAGIMSNIRTLALTTEKIRFFKLKK